MFIKTIHIPNKSTGKRYTYYRLCESYRMGESPRHRTILDLGTLEELPEKNDRKLLADFVEKLVYNRPGLFDDLISSKIKNLAAHYAGIIIAKKLVDVPHRYSARKKEEQAPPPPADYETIDLNSMEHKQVREVGAEWLCKQTLERLDLPHHLQALGWNERWIKMAMIYLTGRCVFPASDLKTEDWLRRNTALAELCGMKAERITRHHLYKVSRMLYRAQESIERHLHQRTGELFELEDKILLYDLTNTYFEGRKIWSKKARFGPSKEKRHDAKLIALALVVGMEGFVKYSKFYEGNIRDHKTLEQTLDDIEHHGKKRAGGSLLPVKKSKRKVVVMDAGIGTEENLKMLREQGYDYVSIALSRMKNYEVVDASAKPVLLKDKEANDIWVQWVKAEGKKDYILQVKSAGKEKKEASMEDLFCKRYEEGLEAIRKGIEKKGGVKKTEKVYERIGRLKAKYPSAHRYYNIKLKSRKEKAIKMSWQKIADGKNRHGIYFIRTTLDCKKEAVLWNIYNTIRQIEATFRVLKTDLRMRPIFHQKDVYTESHLYGSVLAYSIVQSVRHPLKAQGIHADWGNIVRTMNSQKVITTAIKTRTGRIKYIRKCSEPEPDVQCIYQTLRYADRPFWQKKSVLPKSGKDDPEILDTG